MSQLYVDLSLVLDFSSLLFSCSRSVLSRHGISILTASQQLLHNCSVSDGLHKLLQMLQLEQTKSHLNTEMEGEIKSLFLRYFPTIKPKLPGFQRLRELNSDKLPIYCYTLLEQPFWQEIEKLYPELNIIHRSALKLPNKEAVIISVDSKFSKSLEQDSLATIRTVRSSRHATTDDSVHNYTDNFYQFDWVSLLPSASLTLSPPPEIVTATQLDKPYPCSPESFKWNELYVVQSTLPLRLKGRVIHGKKIGSTQLGIPTANLEQTEKTNSEINQILNGVYCGRVKLGAKQFYGAVSVGYNPTFEQVERSVEVYILEDFKSQFYGEELELSIDYFIRADTDCASLGELIEIINLDVTLVRLLQDGCLDRVKFIEL